MKLNRFALVVIVSMCVSPLFAYPWQKNAGGTTNDVKVVTKKDVDKELYEASVKVCESKKVDDATAKALADAIERRNGKTGLETGIGAFGTVDITGDIGADLLFSVGKNGWDALFSVGYGKLNESIDAGEFNSDNVRFGVGIIRKL
jgi:pyruvate/2-oxoglutarate dehydrogenase complex dihydrolipoamide acyltransferase (E2) component